MAKRGKASGAGEASVPPALSASERETVDASVASLSGLNLDQLRLQWWPVSGQAVQISWYEPPGRRPGRANGGAQNLLQRLRRAVLDRRIKGLGERLGLR